MRQIELHGGSLALVDDDDYDRLAAFRWYPFKGRRGAIYAFRWAVTRTIHMQRDVLDPGGIEPPGRLVDHRDHDTLNNQRSNLRWLSYQQSNINRRIFTNNTSGYRGVSWCIAKRKWVARIKHRSKIQYIGVYSSPEEAARAWNNEALRLRGDDAILNVILGDLLEIPQ